MITAYGEKDTGDPGGGRFFARRLSCEPQKRNATREDAYAGSGMADALITKLSNSGQITVRPTSAVLRYVGIAYDPLEAGRALEVDSVLDGKIQRDGDRACA